MSRSALTRAAFVALLVFAASLGASHAQQNPNRPWQALIPDPDTVDWSNNNRPGYRFRGMLPAHERFHEYVQNKRQSGQELSWADRMMIRRLQASRRWPEPPGPNDFWKSFLRYLREQPTLDLNLAQGFMFSEATAYGMIPMDRPQNEDMRKTIEYLSSGPFRARNWFERTFGRVEPWMDYFVASRGYDMTPAAGPASGIFPPGGPFNGLRIRYNITGVTLDSSEDREGFTTSRHYTGTVSPGTVTISGSGSIDSGWDAKLSVYARFGKETVEEEWTFKSPGSQDFNFTVRIPEGTDLSFPPPRFDIVLAGRYSTAGAGSAQVGRGLAVTGSFTEAKTARDARVSAEDAAWREQVEKTLRELGYEQTPSGRELAQMRQALAGGDATWKAWVDRRQRELGFQEGDAERQLDELARAVDAGGPAWEQYATKHGGGRPAQPAGGDAGTGAGAGGSGAGAGGTGAGAGGTGAGAGQAAITVLQVGTDSVDGMTTGIAERFTRPRKLATTYHYRDQTKGALAVAVWTCDGDEILRGERELSGSNGWMSFVAITKDEAGLPPGSYTLTITIGGKVAGRGSFTVVR